MANKEWNVWEKRIKNEARLRGHYPVQVPAEVRGWSMRESFREKNGYPVKVKSFPDFVVGIKNKSSNAQILETARMCVFDAKVTNERVWNLKQHCFNEKKIHQFAEILAAQERGCVGGYLIWFVDYRKIVWAPILILDMLRKEGVASISPETERLRVQDDFEVINFEKLMGFT